MRLFDLHCDTLYECEKQNVSLERNSLHLDLIRGGQYATWCQVFAVWMPDTLRGEAAFDRCCQVLRFARAQAQQYSHRLRLVDTAEELSAAVQGGICGGILAVEGGSALAGRLEAVAALRALGVRVLTLTWNGENEWGYGCGCHSTEGLKPFGKRAVAELERQGILPDVSHLNEAGFWDVADAVSGPFMASHSVLRAVHDHPRNLTDAQFAEICRRGGLVGLNLCEAQLGEQTMDRWYRHLEHGLSLGGEHTIAVGGDLDGTDLPAAWSGIAFAEKLAAYLAQKGYSDELLDRIFFQNAFKFFQATLQREQDTL